MAIHFPIDFLWGAATASYQIEGAANEDGRSESIWDRFCDTPGKVRNGDTGAIACDFYHRYPEDIALMADLGLDAFRFSIAWPRVLPEGRGRVNQPGLDFYDRLVDELLANDIQPFPTLYHWDLPQVLEDAGGWPERATAEAFVEYTEVVASRLGDRVSSWITHNEPWVAAWLGHALGVHAPGRTNTQDALSAAHHLLLSHGWATEVLRRESPGSEVGIALALTHAYPATDSEGDRAAAWWADGSFNRWYLDPLYGRGYPADMVDHFAPKARPCRTATSRRSRRRPTSWVRTTTSASSSARIPTATGRFSSATPTRHSQPWAGRSIRTASTTSSPGSATTTLRRGSTSSRTAPPTTTSAGTTARSSTPSGRPTSTSTSPRSGARSRTACPCAATSPGRCSTTSSGPRATRSASASSMSTTPRSSASRREASTGTATSSRRSKRSGGQMARVGLMLYTRARGLRPRFRGNAARCCLAGL